MALAPWNVKKGTYRRELGLSEPKFTRRTTWALRPTLNSNRKAQSIVWRFRTVAGEKSMAQYGSLSHRRLDCASCQVLHRSGCSRTRKDRRRRVAGIAKRTVAAAVNMVVANVVLAAKRVFEVAGALVPRSACRAAAFTVMLTGFHLSLTFYRERTIAQKQ